MLVGLFSIFIVLAWCLGPAIFYDRLNNAFLGTGIRILQAQKDARETLGLD